MNEQWLQQLKDKMADYKRPAPEVSWDAIDQAMAQRKPKRLWLWRIAAAVVLLLVVGGGYWAFLYDLPQTEVETTSPPTPLPWARGDKKIAGTETETKTGTITGKGTTLSSGTLTETETKTKTKKLAKTESETDVPAESVGVTEAEEVTENTETIVPDEPVKPHETEKKVEPSVNRSRVIYPTEIRQSKMQENRLMAKVYMSNVVVNNRKATDGSHSIDNNPGSNIPDSVRTRYRSKFKGKANYRQPIRVGVSLRYMLNNRWSLESGLTYTHLVSDIGNVTLRNNLIGLPLNVGYQVWNNRHFGLYVSAGGTIEKMLDEKPWQFSVNAALGAEYKFSKRLSLFAEPGIGYYFPNDSDIPIIYQDHPLNFNLNFGLRINIK